MQYLCCLYAVFTNTSLDPKKQMSSYILISALLNTSLLLQPHLIYSPPIFRKSIKPIVTNSGFMVKHVMFSRYTQ